MLDIIIINIINIIIIMGSVLVIAESAIFLKI